jgi:hypothetical protein
MLRSDEIEFSLYSMLKAVPASLPAFMKKVRLKISPGTASCANAARGDTIAIAITIKNLSFAITESEHRHYRNAIAAVGQRSYSAGQTELSRTEDAARGVLNDDVDFALVMRRSNFTNASWLVAGP